MGTLPIQPQRYDNNAGHLNPPPQLLFHHDDTTAAAAHRFPSLPKATRELTIGFIDDNHRFFLPQPPPSFRRPIYASPVHAHPWNVNGRPAGDDGSDGDDDNEELDDANGELTINNDSSNTCGNSSDKIGNNGKQIPVSSFGSSRDLIVKEGIVLTSGDDFGNNNNARASSCENQVSQFQSSTVTIADLDGDLYYSHQYEKGPDGSNVAGHKDASLVENGCEFSGRKDIWYSSESGESLRGILSDPLTGSLMDDAMILPCGHSFGGGGMQHVITMLCELLSRHSVGKKSCMHIVLLKEEERNLNRYVVKTLDNAESVKLQYRSLAKVPGNATTKPISSRMAPNWL